MYACLSRIYKSVLVIDQAKGQGGSKSQKPKTRLLSFKELMFLNKDKVMTQMVSNFPFFLSVVIKKKCKFLQKAKWPEEPLS